VIAACAQTLYILLVLVSMDYVIAHYTLLFGQSWMPNFSMHQVRGEALPMPLTAKRLLLLFTAVSAVVFVCVPDLADFYEFYISADD